MEGSPSLCSQNQGPADWLCSNAQRANPCREEATGILLYHWWNVWKERNKTVFDAVQHNEFQVATSAKEEVDLCISAFRMR
jgi:hypothetical protein